MMKRIVTFYCSLLSFIFSEAQAPVLYTLTGRNGDSYDGTITQYTAGASSNLSVVHSFNNAQSLEGFSSRGGLVLASDGKLYGMTDEGGLLGYGVLFSFDPLNLKYNKLVDFNGSNGKYPSSNRLVQAKNGKLYGTTPYGGAKGVGVLFSFDPVSRAYTKIMDFDYKDGASPYGGLTQASDGKLYGTTFQGGAKGYGVIYSFDPASNRYSKLKDFGFSDGGQPYGDNSLLQASDGKLYGMTLLGGSTGWGVLYSFDPSSSAYTKLRDFDDQSGNYPFGKLVQASNGLLYGMTYYGGANDAGVIFSFNTASAAYTVIKSFKNNEGAYPAGSLMEASDKKLYGATRRGGGANRGVVFSFDLSSNTFTKEKDFSSAVAGSPLYGYFVETKTCVPKKDSITQTVCKSELPYKWNGNTITAAGTYTAALKTASGCDSLAVLTLKVDVKTSFTEETVCASSLPFTWNGQSFTKAGSYEVKLKTAAGCDSVATLTLKIKDAPDSPKVSVTQPACGLTKGAITVTASGTGLSYSIDGANYTNTTGIFTNLDAGKYSVTVRFEGSCTSPAVNVVINTPQATPPKPEVKSPIEYCQGIASSPLTATSSQGFSLLWYAAATGGTGSATAPLLSTTTVKESSYYVSQVNAQGCESERAEIKVKVSPATAVSLKTKADCNGINTITAQPANGSVTDYDFVWTVPAGTSNPGNVASFVTADSGVYTVIITSKKIVCSSLPASIEAIKAFTVALPDVKVLDNGVSANTVYIGYEPATKLTLAPVVRGGTKPYKYKWSDGSTDSSLVVSPVQATTYTVMITDAEGCRQVLSKEIKVLDVSCDGKVRICRRKGNSGFETTCMPEGSIAGQLANGAYLAECRTGGRYADATGVNTPQIVITASPNPSQNDFTLLVQSRNTEPMQLRIRDEVGKLVETKVNITPNSTVRIGGNYRPGLYYAEIIQGSERVAAKLVKQTR